MASDVESSLVSKFQRLNQSLMLVLGINSLMLHRRCNSFLWLLKFDFFASKATPKPFLYLAWACFCFGDAKYVFFNFVCF